MKPRLNRSQILLAFVAILYILAFWYRLLLKGQVPFDGDVIWLFYPNWAVGKKLLKEGFYLLWDPFRNMGQPLLAAPHDEVLYPVRFLCLILNYLDYQRVYIVFHTLLAASFSYALGRDLLKNRTAALLMALGFGFNGFTYWRALYMTNFCALTWLPAVLYFYQKNRPVVLGVCLTFQWLAGYPPFPILTSGGLVALSLVSQERRKRVLCVVKGGVVAAGLSAVQLLPFLEMLRQSIRPMFLGAEIASLESLHPLDLLRHLTLPAFILKPIQHSNVGLSSFFASPLFTLLFIWGFIKGRRRERLMAAFTVIAFILTLGHYTGFYGFLPFVTLFRYPVNWLLLALAGLVFVGSFGLGQLKSKNFQWIVVGLIGLDLLGYAAQRHFGWADLTFVSEAPLRLPGLESVAEGRRLFHTDAIRRSFSRWDLTTREDWILAKGVLMPSYAASQGIKEAASRHSLMSRQVFDYAERLSHSNPDSPLFDYAGIEKIVAMTKEGAAKESPAWKDFGVITNPDPKPRAFMIEGPVPYIIKDKPGKIKLEAHGPGTLVVSEAFYPGWKVHIDGKPGSLEAFEDMFLSTQLDQGRHTVRFFYRPLSFLVGLLISLMTLIALLGSWLFLRRYSDTIPAHPPNSN